MKLVINDSEGHNLHTWDLPVWQPYFYICAWYTTMCQVLYSPPHRCTCHWFKIKSLEIQYINSYMYYNVLIDDKLIIEITVDHISLRDSMITAQRLIYMGRARGHKSLHPNPSPHPPQFASTTAIACSHTDELCETCYSNHANQFHLGSWFYYFCQPLNCSQQAKWSPNLICQRACQHIISHIQCKQGGYQ